jgi:hypothetical protein
MAVLVPGKFLYLATPHTGSRSVAQTLLDGFEGTMQVASHHATLEEVPLDSRARNLVTSVRDPYDLVASWWRRTYAAGKWTSFCEFVREWDDPTYVRENRIFYHWRPGVQVLRFEALQEDFDALLIRHKMPTVKLVSLNRSGDVLLDDYPYDAKSFALVTERFRAEIVEFGYGIRS